MKPAVVKLHPDLKLQIDLAELRIDLTGDGQCGPEESLLTILGLVSPRSISDGQRDPVEDEENSAGVGESESAIKDWRVTLDSGDVLWLRGYCHFLAAFCDVVLAYDHEELTDGVGPFAYPKYVSQSTLNQPLYLPGFAGEPDIADAVAAIHLLDFKLIEPARMKSARQHLLEMIQTSRESWQLILAEADNEQEWLPNPKQTGVLQIPVAQAQIDGWLNVLTEMEDLLEGRKLIPFWRDQYRYHIFGGHDQQVPVGQRRGINLKRYFDEPTDFDLVLMIQGSQLRPYVEQGPMSDEETWSQLMRVFQGNFIGFAVWFN